MNEIEFSYASFGASDKYKIINKKEGIEVEPESNDWCHKSKVVAKFLRTMLDLDQWKHSWHLDAYSYNTDKETKKKIQKILKGKIEGRKREIEELEFALKIIKRKV